MKFIFLRVNLRKLSRVLSIAIIGLLLIPGALGIYLNSLLAPPVAAEKGQTVLLNIPANANADKIANILYQQGLIRSTRVFSIYTRYTGADNQLKAGEYKLNTGQTLPEIVQKLIKGTSNDFVITVPEGYTVQQVADLLVIKELVDKKNFYEAVAEGDFSYPFLEGIDNVNYRLEGYLFPDTYYIKKGSDSKVIIDKMLNRFDKVINDLNYEQKVQEMGLTLHEAVTIASMIEREAKYDDERPLIAGVILNRLSIGMPLQIDATVQYALGANRSKLYNKDLEVVSPYNTYRINGLPPGPIALSGKASLLAVINAQKSDYLYYVAKPDGRHVFSKTLAEHNRNKAKYIR